MSIGFDPALAQTRGAATPARTHAETVEDGPGLPKQVIDLKVRGGYHLTTGNESTAGSKTVTKGTPGTAANPETGGPSPGTTKSGGTTDESFQRKKGTNPSANTDTTSSTSTTTTETTTEIIGAGQELGGGTGPSAGGTLELWLTPRFGLSTSVDAHWKRRRAELSPGGIAGVVVPEPGAVNLVESSKTTISVSSPSAAVDVGPNSRKADVSASGTNTTTTWRWDFGSATFTTRDDVGIAIYTERQQDVASPATPSINAGTLRPGAGSGGFTASREVTLPRAPGPAKVAGSFLQISGPAMSYAPSFTIPAVRGTDGTAGGAGGFNIVYNGADNPGGIASGSVAAPATPLGAQFPTSGIVLVKFPKTKLMPSEGTRGQASGSVATALGTEVEYASTGGGFATTSHETFATLGSALAKMVAWAGNRAELWIGGGLAASYVGSKTLTTIRVAGDDGTGPATQTVTFTQNAPAEKDPPSTLKNRVTLFRETSEIATTKTETSDTTTLLLGPMLAIGGRAALLEGLTVSWSLGYSPVMGGKQTSWTRTDTTGSIKTVMTTEVKTLEATDSASPISTSTTTSTSEEVVDTRNKLDKGAVATSISSAFGMATEAVLGFQYRLGPLTIGVEGRDQVVFGINTLTANGSLGLAS